MIGNNGKKPNAQTSIISIENSGEMVGRINSNDTKSSSNTNMNEISSSMNQVCVTNIYFDFIVVQFININKKLITAPRKEKEKSNKKKMNLIKLQNDLKKEREKNYKNKMKYKQ